MAVLRKDKRFTVADIAAMVGGTVIGNTSRVVHGLCSFEDPIEGHLCFARTTSYKAVERALSNVAVAAVLVPDTTKLPPLAEESAPASPPTNALPSLILVKDPAAALFSLVPQYYQPREASEGVHKLASIDPSATLGPKVHVGPYAVVGADVKIGENAVIHSHVVLYPGVSIGAGSVLHSGVVIREDCEIGEDCIIHNGAIIGADGFGYVPDATLGLRKVPQVGTVRIGDKVEIGANACIDRATLGTTVIDHGAKIDNLAQIAHNVHLGRSAIVCGQVGIAGSVRVGAGAILGGQTGVKDHVNIAAGARVAARSGVSNDIEAGDYAGYPVLPANEWKRQHAALARLTKLLIPLQKLLRGVE